MSKKWITKWIKIDDNHVACYKCKSVFNINDPEYKSHRAFCNVCGARNKFLCYDFRLFSVKELATNLFVNPETVRRWIRSGKLKTKDGLSNGKKGGYLVGEKDLVDFLNGNPRVAIRAKKRLGSSESQN